MGGRASHYFVESISLSKQGVAFSNFNAYADKVCLLIVRGLNILLCSMSLRSMVYGYCSRQVLGYCYGLDGRASHYFVKSISLSIQGVAFSNVIAYAD